MEICQVIKENRSSRQLTQEGLAEILNVSRSTISSWENGRSYPDLEMVLILSKEFDISVDNLLKGDSDIVHEISKDTRSRKKNRIVILILTILILILTVIIFNTQFKVQDITQSDIVSAEIDGEKVVITLKKSFFYKNTVYDLVNDEDDKFVSINIARTFSPLSSGSNIIEVDPDFLNDKDDKPIKIVNERREPIYDVKE